MLSDGEAGGLLRGHLWYPSSCKFGRNFAARGGEGGGDVQERKVASSGRGVLHEVEMHLSHTEVCI